MEVVGIQKVLENKYENFLHGIESCLIYQSIKYRDFLTRIIGCKSDYLIAIENDQIFGALPLMSSDGPLGLVMNSLPFFGSYGGIISKHPLAYDLLSNKYAEIIQSHSVLSSVIIENPFDKNKKQNQPKNELDFRIGQFSPINFHENHGAMLMNSFHGKVRNMIRKAIKENVKVEIDINYLPFLKETHNENMNQIGVKIKPPSFFSELPTFFTNGTDFDLFVATVNHEPVAALLLFYYNQTVEYFTPVIKQSFRSQQPLSLLIYEAMIYASQKGYKYWNWGGSGKTRSGVYLFKSRWNTREVIYQYHISINPAKKISASAEYLAVQYPYFYVIPYHRLNT
jgi:lipid II:glycine glycyltransferase (peptidoglycan interpeptide bridge formation enzyme)